MEAMRMEDAEFLQQTAIGDHETPHIDTARGLYTLYDDIEMNAAGCAETLRTADDIMPLIFILQLILMRPARGAIYASRARCRGRHGEYNLRV